MLPLGRLVSNFDLLSFSGIDGELFLRDVSQVAFLEFFFLLQRFRDLKIEGDDKEGTFKTMNIVCEAILKEGEIMQKEISEL